MAAERERGARRFGDAVLAAGFVAAIGAPFARALLASDDAQSIRAEFRRPEPFPRQPRTFDEAMDWPGRFSAWYGDHFGMRQALLRGHNRALWDAFGVSPTPKFLLGRDDWVFVTEAHSLEAYRGAYPMPPPRVQGWRDMLAARGDWLAAHGMRYLVLIAPSKEQIYGEFLPARLGEPGTNRVDQVLEATRGLAHCEVLDLRPCLRAERAHDGERGADDFVYFRLGTHWTDRGAYAAYVEVLKHLAMHFPKLAPLPREAFTVAAEGSGDSLASQLYMEDELQQTAWRWKLGSARRARYDEAKAATPQSDLDTEVDDPSLPSAVVIHDSFGEGIRTMLAEHFSRGAFIWSLDFDLSVFEESKPDLVIELYVDRTLAQNAPQLWPAGDATRAKRAFDASPRVVASFTGAELAGQALAWERTKLEATGEGLQVRGPNAPPGLVLPRVAVARDELVSLRIEVDSEIESGVDVNYTKPTEREFERRNTAFAPLAKGRNEAFVEILDQGLDGGLMLRFAEPRKSYVLRAVEVRTRVP